MQQLGGVLMGARRSPKQEAAWNERGSFDGCWEWKGFTNPKGYGIIAGSGQVLAHRVSYRELVGPIPDGLCVLHRCDNPPCYNPAHLFLGTRADNNRDMRDKGRHWYLVRETCGNGHPWTPENTGRSPARGHRTCRACMRERSTAGVKLRNEGRDDLLCPAGFQRHRFLGSDHCFKCGAPRPKSKPRTPAQKARRNAYERSKRAAA